MRKPIICLIQLLKCWWFAVNFRWRSSPILFRFCRLSLPWRTLVNRIVGDFNDICCRPLKIAKRFSIANNCKKTNQIKRTWNKNRHEKKMRSKTLWNRGKPNLKLFVILKSPQFLKGPIFIAIGNKVMLFVTRWWQALTISYLTDSFEIIIIIVPKEMFFLARFWQINSKVVFSIFGLKTKEILDSAVSLKGND